MSDPIDKQAAKMKVARVIWEDGDSCYDFQDKCVDCLDDVPSAEPKRKRGRWVWNKNGMDWGLGAWCCSECGIKAETWWATYQGYNPLGCSGGKFCGNCGADLRGEQDG